MCARERENPAALACSTNGTQCVKSLSASCQRLEKTYTKWRYESVRGPVVATKNYLQFCARNTLSRLQIFPLFSSIKNGVVDRDSAP